MDVGDSVAVLLYRTSKPQGKVRRRVLDLRIPSSSFSSRHDFPARGQTLDLSHNESARLAVDCLLSRGLEGYQEVLKAEGEVDFLSELDKRYILENGGRANADDPAVPDVDDRDAGGPSTVSRLSATCYAASTHTDSTLAEMKQSSSKVTNCSDPVLNRSSTQVFFPSDSRVAGMKDLVRQFIRKAKQALAIVTDSFRDVELLCDLLEASRKRNVSVHLLLDHLNLKLFVSMWKELKLDSRSFPKLCVRSVHGHTYCARTGRKLTGQIAESFIINDWTEALTGSFSFSWLSWQVHRSLAVLFTGGSVAPFHQELHRLYTSSTPVPGFVTFIAAPPPAGPPRSTSHRQKKSHRAETKHLWTVDEKADEVQTQEAGTHPVHRLKTEPAQRDFAQAVQPVGRPPAQGAPVPQGEGLPGEGALCSQLQLRVKVDPQESNPSMTYPHPQTHSSTNAPTGQKPKGLQSNLQSLQARAQQKTARHLSALRKSSHVDQMDVGPERPVLQQRERFPLGKPFGVGRRWNCSLNFKPKGELPSDHQKLLSPSASPQLAKSGLQFPFNHPMKHAAHTQPKTFLLEPRAPHQPHPGTQYPGPHPGPAGPGRPLRPQLHADSKGLISGPGAKPPVQLTTSAPRLHWTPQHPPRATERQSSFSSTRGMARLGAGGGGGGGGVDTALGRSRSLTERRRDGFRGTGRNPNRDAN